MPRLSPEETTCSDLPKLPKGDVWTLDDRLLKNGNQLVLCDAPGVTITNSNLKRFGDESHNMRYFIAG